MNLTVICAAFILGSALSNLAWFIFRAEVLAWQKRRQVRKLDLAMAAKLSASSAWEPRRSDVAISQSDEGPFYMVNDKYTDLQLRRMIIRLRSEDRRRFFLYGPQEKH